MANDSIRGRQVVAVLTNKSGGAVAANDVVVLDSVNATSFTTTTTSGQTAQLVGVALEAIASNSAGRVLLMGYTPGININAAAAGIGHYLKTHTVAKQATTGAASGAGVFGQVLSTAAVPPALIWGRPDQGGGGGGGAFVGARYKTAAGQSIPNGIFTIVDFGTQDYDSGSLVTVGAAWKFTAAVAGYYRVSSQLLFSSTANWVLGESGENTLYKNGVAVCNMGRNDHISSAAQYKQIQGYTELYLAAADYIDIRVYQQSGAALTLFADATHNFITVSKIG